jgi:hypothetical protein
VLDPDFYPMLTTRLPAERTGTTPSAADFAHHELPRVVARLESAWEAQPVFPALPEARQLVLAGRLVYAFSVIAQLRPDGNIHLLRIDIDTDPPPTDDEHA